MKHFVIIVKLRAVKNYEDVTLSVYRIKKNRLCTVGTAFYNTGGMKGHKSEAMDVLLEHKEISKKVYGDGYYDWHMAEDGIMEIQEFRL